MLRTKQMPKKLLSVLLAAIMLFSMIPATALIVSADDARTADASSLDGWKQLFGPDVQSTENIGTIWTDKTVLTDATAFAGVDKIHGDDVVSIDNENSFLVALSALGSTKKYTGYGASHTPADIVLVLDFSGSMANLGSSGNNLADEMIEAANESLDTLLSINKHNRVGVVAYSGSSSSQTNSTAAVTLLPLGRYETAEDGIYLTYTLQEESRWPVYQEEREDVCVDSDVVYEGTDTKPVAITKDVVGATYIQSGILLAKDQFVDKEGDTVVQDPDLGEIDRLPIMVLMSDGQPTLGSTSFTDLSDTVFTGFNERNNLGDGSSSSAALGFVSQLSAAYAKSEIDRVYGNSRFYTLGLNVGDTGIAHSVLNPTNSTSAIDNYWASYNQAAVGDEIRVQYFPNRNVTKIATALDQNYVDKFFNVKENPGTTLAQGLTDAFEDIVASVEFETAYYPTLVEENDPAHSGYITFQDTIGEYMEVKDIKGLVIANTFYCGATLAENFVEGGGALGTYDNPTELGIELVASIATRLGLTVEEAQTLLGLAYQHGQIHYAPDTHEFSNYVGWYANAAGEFLGFWYDGITTMPDPADPTLTDETRPVYVYKSYAFLGAVDEDHGVKDTDMLYATIRVRREIATGEERVMFSVPATLIPLVEYNVEVDAYGNLISLDIGGATDPLRLVYEVGLKDGLDAYNVQELVGDEYAYIDEDGVYHFYTNAWTDTAGYLTKNARSVFEPSLQNEKYYYTKDSGLYVADGNRFVLYEEAQLAENLTYYVSNEVYAKNGSTLSTTTEYTEVLSGALSAAERTAAGWWFIPAGTVRTAAEPETILKGTPNTATFPYVSESFFDIQDRYYNGATLGNNGTLALTPVTGIAISKQLSSVNPDAPQGTAFTFLLQVQEGRADGAYELVRVLADGTRVTGGTVTFRDNAAKVTLNAGETVYVIGLSEDTYVSVTEEYNRYYAVASVNGDSEADSAGLSVEENRLVYADFINAPRGAGNVTISKEVIHSLGTNYVMPDIDFEMTLTFTGEGVLGVTFDASHSGDASLETITVGQDGTAVISLSHGEVVEIFDLPEGTVVSATESVPAGFTATYLENGLQTPATRASAVTVENDIVSSIEVINTYTPAQVAPVNVEITGNKTLSGRDWQEGDSFTFRLERRQADGSFVPVGDAVTVTNETAKTFDFNDAIADEVLDQPGAYYYRVVELIPATTIAGVTYDRTIHAFTVNVTDRDMNGRLEIASVVPESDYTTVTFEQDVFHAAVSFTNTYSASGSDSVYLEIEKTVANESGNTLITPAGFTFTLYNADGSVKAVSESTTARGFARVILDFTADDIGNTYRYTVRENAPNPVPAGWTYSSEEYTVIVTVEDDLAGGVKATISVEGQAATAETDTASISFENTYAPEAIELSFSAEKTLLGRDLIDGEFTFALLDVTGATVATGTNDANGLIEFVPVSDTALVKTAVGTYTYDMVETTEDGRGITVDRNSYRVQAIVTDEGGVFAADYRILNSTADTVVFRNTYTTTPADLRLTGLKRLTGRTLLNDQFTFLLTPAHADGTAISGATPMSAHNYADGSFHFDLSFEEAGTYYYLLSEAVPAAKNGVEYDTVEYLYEIVVTDDLAGTLSASRSFSVYANGQLTASPLNAPEFVNRYVPTPITVDFDATKQLVGKVLANGQFSFIAVETDENYRPINGGFRETVSNDAQGIVTFPSIRYTEKGTYYYIVEEVGAGSRVEGINFGTASYRVRVVVEDDLRGNLSATVSYFDEHLLPVDEMLFVNEYVIIGEVDLEFSGEKTLLGRDRLENEAFDFELYQADSAFAPIGAPLSVSEGLDHRFTFNLHFTEQHVSDEPYYFIVKEANAGQTIDGVTYDDSVYQISVRVLDNGVGGIETEVNIHKTGTLLTYKADQLDFVNSYAADGTDAEIDVLKTLAGRTLLADEFSFALYAAEADTFEVRDGSIPMRATNAADGTLSFALTYEQAGTYAYRLVEDLGDAERVTYDTRVYLVTIVVEDDLHGNLVAADPVYQVAVLDPGADPVATPIAQAVSCEDAEGAVFENVFTPKPEDVEINFNVKKTVKNVGTVEMGPEGFSFQLLNTTTGDNAVIVTSDEEGNASFRLVFTEDDIGATYLYRITEVAGDLANVTYSSAVYEITAEITLSEDNVITVRLTNADGEVEEVRADFENVYDYTPPAPPQTGDNGTAALWFFLSLLSASCLAFVLILSRKNRKQTRA